MDKSVSLIIPAYNIAEYLPACLDSVLKNRYENYEIILVDDGSTDQTAEICDEYQKHSAKVKVIHQKNAGLSAARNTGIKQARGDYLAFVDGDDLVAKDFLARLAKVATTSSAEIVECGFKEFSGSTPVANNTTKVPEILTGEAAAIRLLVEQENKEVVTWNKLYKRDLFKNIKFPVGELHEDTLTTYKLLAAAKTVAIIDDELYYYRQRPGSIMDEQDLLARLKQKERAAREAISYFTPAHPTAKTGPQENRLLAAAEIALLLSKFAYLDNLAAGRLKDRNLWQKTIKEINSVRQNYRKNPYLTKKLKLYLTILKAPVLYRLFRKIIH